MKSGSKKKIIGYASVTADILHSGHISYLLTCFKQCDYLIVGLMSDECVKSYKGKYPIMNYDERLLVVSSLWFVSCVIPQDTYEFPESLKKKKLVDIIFDSTDHRRRGADMVIPYKAGVSSTLIKRKIKDEY